LICAFSGFNFTVSQWNRNCLSYVFVQQKVCSVKSNVMVNWITWRFFECILKRAINHNIWCSLQILERVATLFMYRLPQEEQWEEL
jgi:hypothetical protein